MKKILVLILAVACCAAHAQKKDWLIDGSDYKAQATLSEDKSRLTLSNGLLSRTFSLQPNGATIALDNLMTGQSELRAIRPEAEIRIDGHTYAVGGLDGQPVQNFLTDGFIGKMTTSPNAFVMTGHEIRRTQERFPWKPNRQWISNSYEWPAPGVQVVFSYRAQEHFAGGGKNCEIKVYYELYDGAPILSKWMEVKNNGTEKIIINSFKSEILALVETAPKVKAGEPHEVRIMAQEPGHYIRNDRRAPVQADSGRTGKDSRECNSEYYHLRHNTLRLLPHKSVHTDSGNAREKYSSCSRNTGFATDLTA